MATVMSPQTCPQCGYQAAYGELDCRTFEEWLFCPRCGYRYWVRRVRDRCKMQARADDDHRLYFRVARDGKPIFRAYERPGFGACALFAPNGAGVYCTYKQPPTQADVDRLAALVAAGTYTAASYITDGAGQALFGPGPQLEPDDEPDTESAAAQECVGELPPEISLK